MVLVTIDSVSQQDGDIRTCDRILKGLFNLKQSGYTVERFEAVNESGEQSQKRIVAITRTSIVDDAGFEEWLKNLLEGEPDNDGE